MTITDSSYYLSFYNGQHAKILTDKSLSWAFVFGQYCYAHVLDQAESFLIIGGTFTNSAFGKVNSTDGTIMSSYSYNSSTLDPTQIAEY